MLHLIIPGVQEKKVAKVYHFFEGKKSMSEAFV